MNTAWPPGASLALPGRFMPAGERAGPAVRPWFFSPWADGPAEAAAFLAALPALDVRARTADPGDAGLVRKARLDCDWYGECARCFATMAHPELDFRPAQVVGPAGMTALIQAAMRKPAAEDWWLLFIGQHPQKLAPVAGRTLAFLRRCGLRILYYAFDEASRRMPCFSEIAPHLDVLIHDESPLADAGRARLRPDTLTIHRSWVANVVPFAAPFNEEPEEKILFLGSQLGLTPHRRRQIEFLQKTFKDRFVASCDHSVGVGDRFALNRFKVGFCPEGRMFATPAMAATHTDRPFWSGCLGLVPVSEDSRPGGRLDELARAGLILRYPHGDLKALAAACERALATTSEERRRIHEHFNAHETVGPVVAGALAAFAPAGAGSDPSTAPL